MDMNKAISTSQETIDEIVSTVETLSTDCIQWKPSEEEWSVQEVLVHLEEAIPYWLNEIKRIQATPGVKWGRGLKDEQRLAALEKAPEADTKEVLNVLTNMKKTVEDELSQYDNDLLNYESESVNPRFGTKPVSFIVDHLVVEHLITHHKQIERNIANFKKVAQ